MVVLPRRRVSYIIPSPSESIPRLQLPPHGVSKLGTTGPLLTPFAGQTGSNSKGPNHPRHRLGVASLALDTSTQLVGRAAPEGILYSGGRDGLVMSWELGIPMKTRKVKTVQPMKVRLGRWEIMTGWGDDFHDDDLEDEERVNDGDVLGDVTHSLHRRRRRAQSKADEIPYEHQWETDLSVFQPGTVCDISSFGYNISYPVPSPLSSDSPHRPTLTGSMISSSATIIKQVRSNIPLVDLICNPL